MLYSFKLWGEKKLQKLNDIASLFFKWSSIKRHSIIDKVNLTIAVEIMSNVTWLELVIKSRN